jgi:hypothetical protein
MVKIKTLFLIAIFSTILSASQFSEDKKELIKSINEKKVEMELISKYVNNYQLCINHANDYDAIYACNDIITELETIISKNKNTIK